MAQPLADQIVNEIAAHQTEIASHQAIVDGLTERLTVLERAKAILDSNPELQSLIDRLDLDVRVPNLDTIVQSLRATSAAAKRASVAVVASTSQTSSGALPV